MMKARSFLQGFFWFAFAVFLATSIPHVAYFFHTFEPQEEGLSGVFWWTISYFIAACIDVTIFLSSMTVASLQRRGSSKALIISVWVFIIGLACFSWFINYKYAIQFAHTSMLSATSVTIPWINITIPDIDPILASSFQILAVVYTWISDKIAADEKVLTAEQLKKMADELEDIAEQKARIAEIKRGSSVNRLKSLMDAGKDVVSHAKSTLAKEVLPDEIPHGTDESNVFISERTTDELNAITHEEFEENAGLQSGEPTEEKADNKERKPRGNREERQSEPTEENIPSWLSGKGTTISLDEVVKHTNVSRRKLNHRVETKVIRATKSKDIVYKDSLIAWLKREGILQETVKNDNVSSQVNPDEITAYPGQDTLPSEDRKEVLSADKKLTITLEALMQKPGITDEQLAVILGVDSPAKARFWRLKTEMVKQ